MKIAVIGDSSSSTIGNDSEIYPKVLFKELKKHTTCEITNFSVPGVTSSDAKFIFTEKILPKDFNAVIIYLGNNESVYGKHKGYLNSFVWKIKKIFKKESEYNNRLFLENKFKFSDTISDLSVINSNNDFKKNLFFIIKKSLKKKIFVILINPIANKFFYPSIGLNNYEYFKFIDSKENLSELLVSSDDESSILIGAIAKHENNDFEEAKEIYLKLSNSKNQLIACIAKNNYATILSKTDYKKSLEIYKGILDISKKYNPIIYYNLYLLEKKKKNTYQSKKYLQLSYNSDFYSYRIKDNYRNTIENIKDIYQIEYVDLKNILTDSDFIDYCHPTSNGHKKISIYLSELILKKIEKKKNVQNSEFINQYISPDYFNDQSKTFIEYSLIEKKVGIENIQKNLRDLLASHDFKEIRYGNISQLYQNQELKIFLINFLKVNLKHPIFPESMLENPIYTPHDNEIFSLPENYIYRLLYNYMKLFENKIEEKISLNLGYTFSSKFYKKILLRNVNYDLNLPIQNISEHQKHIKDKVIYFLNNNENMFKDIIDLRYKTIVFWYTRESFRYGTLSRNSMLYDRVNIDRLIESIIVWIINEFKDKKENVFYHIKIIDQLKLLLQTHEKNINKFLSKKNFSSSVYEMELTNIRGNIIKILEKI